MTADLSVVRIIGLLAAAALLAFPAAGAAQTCCWVTYIGTAAPDHAVGHEGDSHLDGRGGGDRLYGGLGNDTLLGRKGIDVLVGGPGFDYCKGGLGRDIFLGCEIIDRN